LRSDFYTGITYVSRRDVEYNFVGSPISHYRVGILFQGASGSLFAATGSEFENVVEGGASTLNLVQVSFTFLSQDG